MRRIIVFLIFSCIFFNCSESTTVIKYLPNEEQDPVIENPIEEVDIMMKAVPESNNYFFRDDKKLYSVDYYGVNLINVVDVDGKPLILDDFFRKNGESFFTIKSYTQIENPEYDPACDPLTETCAPEFLTQEVFTHFRQTENEIAKVDILPVKPPVSRAQYESEIFWIRNNEWEGQMVSDIRNVYMDSGIDRFFLIDGAVIYIEMQGLYFHAREGRFDVRQPGLYFWPWNRTTHEYINTTGILW